MSKVKTVLIFTKEYHHPKISASGGTGVFYKNLAQKLRDRGVKILVFGSAKKAVQFQENGIDFHFVQDYFRKNPVREMMRSITGKHDGFKNQHLKFYIQEKKYLAKQLQKFLNTLSEKPQIIETHDWEGVSLFLDSINIPYCVRFHGSWNILESVFGYHNISKGKKHCEKIALSKSSHNIFISKWSEQINRDFYSLPSGTLIYNGIDTDFWQKESGTAEDPYSIYYLGEVKMEKGAETAAEAFRILSSEFPEAKLFFIGKVQDDNRNRVLEIAGNTASKNISFLGNLPAESIRTQVQKASVMYFPSFGENFSLSLLECLSLERAVITSAIPSFQELIIDRENGMIASGAEEFAEKTRVLFQNPELRKNLGAFGRKLVVDQFSINEMVSKTILQYERITAQ